jgi:SAM-dependent methyltransferase
MNKKDSLYYELSDFYWLYASKKDYSAETSFLLSQIREHHPAARTILDIGCGQGYHLWHFQDAGYDVVGIDKSEEQISAARKQLPEMDLRTGDYLTHPINQKFDVNLILWNTLLYFSPPRKLDTVFDNVKRNLYPDGIVLIDFRSFQDHIDHGEFQEQLVRDLEEKDYHMHLKTANSVHGDLLVENTTTSIFHKGRLLRKFTNDPVYLNILSIDDVKSRLSQSGLEVEAILDGDSLYRNEVRPVTEDTRSYFVVARNPR